MQSNDHKNAQRNLMISQIGKSRRACGVEKGEHFPGRAELDMGSWVSAKK